MKQKTYHVLGVMSGTSLDGLDLAEVRFSVVNGEWNFAFGKCSTPAYPLEWKQKLSHAVSLSASELTNLDRAYTQYLAAKIKSFIAENKLVELEAVCSHGHTVFHEPEHGVTVQIGNRPELSELLQQKVICDFRVQDVELGGQGAPLVPIGDQLLFSKYDYCLNLGGFANISSTIKGERIAFDICAVNTVLNFLAEKCGKTYDENGKMASTGKIDTALLEELNKLAFYRQQPPKSLGIEWVNAKVLPKLSNSKLKTVDLLASYVEHVALQITAVLQDSEEIKLLVTGGGAYNTFLMERIKAHTGVEIAISSEELIDFKEALIFGFLGVLKLRNETNVLKSVTGATRNHSSGKIYKP